MPSFRGPSFLAAAACRIPLLLLRRCSGSAFGATKPCGQTRRVGRHDTDKLDSSSRKLPVCPLRWSSNPGGLEESPPPGPHSISRGITRHPFRSARFSEAPAPPVSPPPARPPLPCSGRAETRATSRSFRSYLRHSPREQRLNHLVDDQAPGITPETILLPRLALVFFDDSSHVGRPGFTRDWSWRYVPSLPARHSLEAPQCGTPFHAAERRSSALPILTV